MTWDGSVYNACDGTSMSCPVVSGTVALWLEANPELDIDDVKQLLAETSANDDFTEANPIRWGYGKINPVVGIQSIKGGTTAIRNLNDATRTNDGILYDLQGRNVTRPEAGFYIMGGKKVLCR